MSEGPAGHESGGSSIGFVSPKPVHVRRFFQEFLVDILGGLVPGIVLWMGTLAALVLPLYVASKAAARDTLEIRGETVKELLELGGTLNATVWFFIFLGIIIVVYVFGHLFYRRDPKDPDRASVAKLQSRDVNDAFSIVRDPEAWRTSKFKDCEAPALPERRLALPWLGPSVADRKQLLSALTPSFRNNYGIETADDCEFPYDHFAHYLAKRGLTYLMPLVTWRPNAHSEGRRSKLYINILKERVTHLFPERSRSIVKNEAHVRLASGTWHVAGTLERIALLGAAISLLAVSIEILGRHRSLTDVWSAAWLWSLLLPAAVMLLCTYSRRWIETFFHYQRMREVVYVLETAYFSFRDHTELLGPPFPCRRNGWRPVGRATETRRKLLIDNRLSGIWVDRSDDWSGIGVEVEETTGLQTGEPVSISLSDGTNTGESIKGTLIHVTPREPKVWHIGMRLAEASRQTLRRACEFTLPPSPTAPAQPDQNGRPH